MSSLILPRIYVPKSIGDARKAWFNAHKYGVLYHAAKENGALSETQEVYFHQAKVVSDHINELINENEKIDGFRIYFGTYGPNQIESKRGRFNLIFVSTTDKHDSGVYYIKGGKPKDNTIEPISKELALEYVGNFQTPDGKRDRLTSTLTVEDKRNKCFETKHLWFDIEKIKELRDLIEDHLKKYSGYGLKIRLVSYTDEDEIEGAFGGIVPQTYKQRLTVDFIFIDENNSEIYLDDEILILRTIETIAEIGHSFIEDDPVWRELLQKPYDRARLDKILDLLNTDEYKILRDMLNNLYTMDTGDPTPPPSTDNMAALDVSDK